MEPILQIVAVRYSVILNHIALPTLKPINTVGPYKDHYFQVFLKGISLSLFTLKKNTVIGLCPCRCFQKTECVYRLYFSFYNFLKYEKPEIC
jgi:hypothetical protein